MPRVLQLTDTHHRPDEDPVVPPRQFADAVHLLTGRTTDEAAGDVVAAVRAELGSDRPLDLVVHTGDIADTATPASYVVAEELLARVGAPGLVTPGNHDDPRLVEATFGDATAITTAYLDVDGWRVVLASSFHAGQHGGRFDDTTLVELERLLECNMPVLVGTHHPPLSPCTDADCVIANAARFLEVIDRHSNVAGVMSGHLHVTDEIIRRGVRYLLSPSTSLQLRHEHPLSDNNHDATAAGARLIDLLDDGSLHSTLVWA